MFEITESAKRPVSPEIVNFDNEPRVRTPKTVRHRYSTPEKDRDYNEMEVTEKAIESTRSEGVKSVKTDTESTNGKSESNQTQIPTSSSSMEEQKAGTNLDEGLKPEPKDQPKKGKSKKKGSAKDKRKDSASTKADSNPPAAQMKLLDTKLDLDDEIKESAAGRANHETDLASTSRDVPPKDQVLKSSSRGDEATTAVIAQQVQGEDVVLSTSTNAEKAGNSPEPEMESLQFRISADGKVVDDDDEGSCTESFRQLKPFNFDLEPVEEVTICYTMHHFMLLTHIS
jgi:hypothetical protein